VKIAFVGGSLTAGLDAEPGKGYAEQAMSMLSSVFPGLVESQRYAVPHMTSGLASRCSIFQPEFADIVFLELAHDDRYQPTNIDEAGRCEDAMWKIQSPVARTARNNIVANIIEWLGQPLNGVGCDVAPCGRALPP
jgi:hypothetical protein